MAESHGIPEGERPGPVHGTPRSRSALVIAIDGPVGAGKSTMARRLASALGCVHIDSGAMYRALGWKAVREGVELTDHARLAKLAATTDVRILPGPAGSRVLVDGEEVTHALRSQEMDQAASLVSTCPAVRERLVALQRSMAEASGVVMDGRDIGTVVFPDADLKFFLDADLIVRAERRRRDLERAGAASDPMAVREEVARRDARDRAREVSPLRPAHDAIRIDSTELSADEVVQRMLAEVTRLLEQDKS
jgi:cytidylate kinase